MDLSSQGIAGRTVEHQRLKFELQAMEILLNAKQEQVTRSNRRSQRPICFP